MRHQDWFNPDPARVIDLATDGAIASLVDTYCGPWRNGDNWNRRRILKNVLTTAFDLGAKTAIVEHRYTDIDFRDEHSRFYSKTFRHYPPTAHRVHFFLDDPPHQVYEPDVAAVFDNLRYLGYTVLRPVQGAAVGRTMLAVPNELRASVTCVAEDKVNFFGKSYTVTAAPFMAQDHQLGICAHAAAWVVSYYHHLRYGGQRSLPGEISEAVTAALTAGRSIPMPGMRVEQLCDALESASLPPVVYWTRDASIPRDIDKIARRYLDSAIPLLVGTHDHAFTLIGYQEGPRGHTNFITQDDEVGPYQKRTRPSFNWASDAWKYIVAPLPLQLYIPCEAAEPLGRARLRQDLDESAHKRSDDPIGRASKQMLHQLGLGRRASGYGFVTSAIRSNDFKSTLLERGYSEKVARGYMRIPMSKWIWVVEIVDLARFRSRSPSVVAEAVIDSTEHIRDTHVLAWRTPGVLKHWNGDTEEVGTMEIDVDQPHALSACATSNSRTLEPR